MSMGYVSEDLIRKTRPISMKIGIGEVYTKSCRANFCLYRCNVRNLLLTKAVYHTNRHDLPIMRDFYALCVKDAYKIRIRSYAVNSDLFNALRLTYTSTSFHADQSGCSASIGVHMQPTELGKAAV